MRPSAVAGPRSTDQTNENRSLTAMSPRSRRVRALAEVFLHNQDPDGFSPPSIDTLRKLHSPGYLATSGKGIRGSGVTEFPRGLLRLDTRRLDHLAPLFRFGGDELPKSAGELENVHLTARNGATPCACSHSARCRAWPYDAEARFCPEGIVQIARGPGGDPRCDGAVIGSKSEDKPTLCG